MSADRERLAELVEMVRGASGPDREIDTAIDLAFCPEGESRKPGDRGYYVRSIDYPDGSFTVAHVKATPYTSSIDAALGLVERLLPGWVIDHIGQDAVGSLGKMKPAGWTGEISDGFNRPHQGQAPTLPLAILTAVLLSLGAFQ